MFLTKFNVFIILFGLYCKIQCFPQSVAPESKGYQFVRQLGYYKHHNTSEGATWDDAVKICENELPNAHLVILNSEEEARWISYIIQFHEVESDGGRWSLGGFYRVQGDEFVTIFNQPLNETGYNVWKDGEPNGTGDCGNIHYTGRLDDAWCTSIGDFICELEI